MDKRKVELLFNSEAGIPDAVVTLRPVDGSTEFPVRVMVVGEGAPLLADELLAEVKEALAEDGNIYVVTAVKLPMTTETVQWESTNH